MSLSAVGRGEEMLTFARLRPLVEGIDARRRLAYEVHRGTDNDDADEVGFGLFFLHFLMRVFIW